MTAMRTIAAALTLLLVGRLSSAGQEPVPAECEAAEGSTQVVRVRWHGPEGVPLGAAAAAVTYPTTSLVVPGQGSTVPPDTRVEGPHGAMFGVADEDGVMRIVVARAEGMEGQVLVRVRFRRCKDSEAPAADGLRCRVVDASDDRANPLAGVACSATLE